MKAVILVGGKATRLLPLTSKTPKAMVPVLNVPFLEHVIRHLAKHQINEIVLAQGHLAPPMADYLGDGSRCGVKLFYSYEKEPLGTAGAVKNAEKFLAGPFLVLNGDVFTDLDFSAMLAYHQEKKAKITIALTPVEDPTSYGLVETKPDGAITRFLEKPGRDQITTNMINAGTYVLEPEVLSRIPVQLQFSFEHEVFPPALARGEPVFAYASAAYWIDIGTPAKYLQVQRDLLAGRCRQYAITLDKEATIGKGCTIHPAAKIKGPVVIADYCTIGRNANINGPVVLGKYSVVGEESLVEDSVIWRNARLGTRARVKKSVLADNCSLRDGAVCEDVVLGDSVCVESGITVEPGSRVQPNTLIRTCQV